MCLDEEEIGKEKSKKKEERKILKAARKKEDIVTGNAMAGWLKIDKQRGVPLQQNSVKERRNKFEKSREEIQKETIAVEMKLKRAQKEMDWMELRKKDQERNKEKMKGDKLPSVEVKTDIEKFNIFPLERKSNIY